jgi:cobalt-zinc-cadmium efflux system protein|uniref:Cation transporter n=1 Tax=Desulfobacca acetoxidans TaxID=60893 RepID=A0A7C5ALZ5_9BACT
MNDHAAGEPHAQRFQSSRNRLLLAFLSQTFFLVIEFVGGILTNSLALIADAGHMFSDVAALGLSLVALVLAQKPQDSRKTYGYHRLEILAALVNGLALWAMAGYILYEAYGRLFKPPEIGGLPMIIIGVLGLMANLFGVIILHPAREGNLNLKSAFLHLLYDAVGSVAAIMAGLVIYFKEWFWFDPAAGAIIAVLIILGSWRLVKEATDILLEATPAHLDLKEVSRALEQHPGVREIHDLHVWTIGSGLYSLSVHAVLQDAWDRDLLIRELEDLLCQRFGLEHTTIQLEGPGYLRPPFCPWSPGQRD